MFTAYEIYQGERALLNLKENIEKARAQVKVAPKVIEDDACDLNALMVIDPSEYEDN